MAGEGICGSCFKQTKYRCLQCHYYFYMVCSIFENDEDTPVWKEGKSVAYCELCCNDISAKRLKTGEDGDKTDAVHEAKPNKTEKSPRDSKEIRAKKYDDLQTSADEDEEEEYDDDDDGVDELSFFTKKSQSKKKAGRRSLWIMDDVDDFIDIVVNNEHHKKKLIFTNTKNQRNGEIYERIKKELQERAEKRQSNFTFSINQMRTKFKRCVSDCKNAAMTIKTATGIKRFQDEQGYGKWFPTLFALVKTRESCQPEQAVEPSASPSPSTASKDSDDLDDSSVGTEMFIPIKRAKRDKSKSKFDSVIDETLDLVKKVVKNDPTKDLINYMKEEMEKAREHEIKLFEMLLNSRQNAHPAFNTYNGQGPSDMHMHNMSRHSVFSRNEASSGAMYPPSRSNIYCQWYY